MKEEIKKQNKKDEKCPLCNVSEETIERLKESAKKKEQRKESKKITSSPSSSRRAGLDKRNNQF